MVISYHVLLYDRDHSYLNRDRDLYKSVIYELLNNKNCNNKNSIITIIITILVCFLSSRSRQVNRRLLTTRVCSLLIIFVFLSSWLWIVGAGRAAYSIVNEPTDLCASGECPFWQRHDHLRRARKARREADVVRQYRDFVSLVNSQER